MAIKNRMSYVSLGETRVRTARVNCDNCTSTLSLALLRNPNYTIRLYR